MMKLIKKGLYAALGIGLLAFLLIKWVFYSVFYILEIAIVLALAIGIVFLAHRDKTLQ